jgi:hypothetical protein
MGEGRGGECVLWRWLRMGGRECGVCVSRSGNRGGCGVWVGSGEWGAKFFLTPSTFHLISFSAPLCPPFSPPLRYGRDALAIGVLLLFTPALLFTVKTLGGAVPTSAPRLNEPEPGLAAGSAFSAGGADTLFRLWLCKALLNCWRCLTALFRIHVMLWPKWRPVAQPTREGMATA